MLKRGLDLVVGSVLLVLVLPVLAVAVILIKLETGDPAFFCQNRMGRGFRPFRLFKLRTMRSDRGGSSYTFGRDPRITRVGYWLRRFKIDELPQFWNVLAGEMSLVGPRPVIPELAEEFRAEYGELLRVRPGLTDPASVKYVHESEMLACERDPMRIFKQVVTPDKLRISLEYQRRATLWSDLTLLVRTARAVLTPAPAAPRVPAPRTAKVILFRPQLQAGASTMRLEPVLVPLPAEVLAGMEQEAGAVYSILFGKKSGNGGWV